MKNLLSFLKIYIVVFIIVFSLHSFVNNELNEISKRYIHNNTDNISYNFTDSTNLEETKNTINTQKLYTKNTTLNENTKKAEEKKIKYSKEIINSNTEPITVLIQACENNDKKACFLAGVAYSEDNNIDKTLYYYKKACQLKHQAGCEIYSKLQEIKDETLFITKGKILYQKCLACHGKYGEIKALGKSNIIAGQSVNDLEAKINAYKNGLRNVAGMGMLMKGQVSFLNEEEIKYLAKYISNLNPRIIRENDNFKNVSNTYKVVNIRYNDTLNVRSNPYVTKYNKIGELLPNAKGIKVIKCVYNKNGSKWCKISHPSTPSGWVSAKYLKIENGYKL